MLIVAIVVFLVLHFQTLSSFTGSIKGTLKLSEVAVGMAGEPQAAQGLRRVGSNAASVIWVEPFSREN